MMAEIRQALKKKAEKGQPSISNKEANRTWREDILGVFSDDQKKEKKIERQNKAKNKKFKTSDRDE